MAAIKKITECTTNPEDSPALTWLQEQLSRAGKLPTLEEINRKQEEEEKRKKVKEIMKQKDDLEKQLLDLGIPSSKKDRINTKSGTDQEQLINQLKATLGKGDPGSQDKQLMKALLTADNLEPGAGGTSALRPDIISRITGNPGPSGMAEWTSNFNRQEEGESRFDMCEGENCKHPKVRSGILDKATTNVVHKEIWPQQNLGEDWAEEEIDFKQLKFEHLVAREPEQYRCVQNQHKS